MKQVSGPLAFAISQPVANQSLLAPPPDDVTVSDNEMVLPAATVVVVPPSTVAESMTRAAFASTANRIEVNIAARRSQRPTL